MVSSGSSMRLPSRLVAATILLALLVSGATAGPPRTVKLRFPRLAIPAGTNPEEGLLVRVPATAPFDLASIEIRHPVGGGIPVQPFLVCPSTGAQSGEVQA